MGHFHSKSFHYSIQEITFLKRFFGFLDICENIAYALLPIKALLIMLKEIKNNIECKNCN